MKNAQDTPKPLKSSNETSYHNTHSLKEIKSVVVFLQKRSTNNKVKVIDKLFIGKEFYNQPSICCQRLFKGAGKF